MDIESASGLLLITLGAVLVLGPLVKRASHQLGVPFSVGYILLGLAAGALLRPSGVLNTPVFTESFSILAQLGVVALLFRVGLRSHTRALIDKLPSAALIWIINVLGTFATGFLLARYGLHWSLETSLVIGTAFTATSIAVSLAAWDELGLANSDTGQTLLDVAELDDLSAAVLLAILLGALPAMLNGDGGLLWNVGSSAVAALGKLSIFILGCYLFAHYLEHTFTHFNRQLSDSPASLTISILGAGLVIAAAADYLGFSIAVGALFAGLAFSRDPDAVHEDGNFTYFYEFLTPFFFIHIGMQTDVRVLLEAVDVGLVLFLAATVSKLAFTALPALRSLTMRDSLNLGVSMIPRAEIALVVMYECRAVDAEIIPPEVFAAVVVVSVLTSIAAPVALRRLLSDQVDARHGP